MTFTQEEEKILKLMAAEVKARLKLDIENKIMGDEIRAEFKIIDERIRAEHFPIFTPLQDAKRIAQENLIKEFE